MKRKTIFLLVLFTVLFIGPMIATATEYEASDQSITSFGETLPDDVMFRPDSTANETVTATSGELVGGSETNSYTDTFTVGTAEWKQSLASAGHIGGILNFTHTESVSGGEIYIRIKGNAITNGKVSIYDYTVDDWAEHQTLTINATYYYYTLDLTSDNAEDMITRVRYNGTTGGGGGYLWCDYAISTSSSSDLESDTHFVEGFNDVSDWSVSVGTGISSDGDEGYFDLPDDNDYDRYYSNAVSIPAGVETVWEIRIRSNDTPCYLGVYAYSTDGYGSGSTIPYPILDYFSVAGNTLKSHYDGTYALECVVIIAKALTVGHPCRVYFDYLRISPANESGWQHDGSTTAGIIASVDASVSSDGNGVNLTSTDISQTVDFYLDTTTTKQSLQPDYYPFFEISISDLYDEGDNGVYQIWFYDSVGGYERMDLSYSTITGIRRFNILATGITDVEYVRIWILNSGAEKDDFLTINYTKFYSIANFTVSQHASNPVDHYLYCDSGTLYRVGSHVNNYFITLDYDPSLSVDADTPISSTWELETSNYDSGRNDYALGLYDGAWDYVFDTTSGNLPSGTITDLRLISYNANSFSSVTFLLPIPQWNDAEDITVYFHVPFDYWAFDMLLIFLGLGMIILSTLYGAYKIRNDPDMNTMLVVLLLFMFGFALFLGGIGFVGGG